MAQPPHRPHMSQYPSPGPSRSQSAAPRSPLPSPPLSPPNPLWQRFPTHPETLAPVSIGLNWLPQRAAETRGPKPGSDEPVGISSGSALSILGRCAPCSKGWGVRGESPMESPGCSPIHQSELESRATPPPTFSFLVLFSFGRFFVFVVATPSGWGRESLGVAPVGKGLRPRAFILRPKLCDIAVSMTRGLSRRQRIGTVAALKHIRSWRRISRLVVVGLSHPHGRPGAQPRVP